MRPDPSLVPPNRSALVNHVRHIAGCGCDLDVVVAIRVGSQINRHSQGGAVGLRDEQVPLVIKDLDARLVWAADHADITHHVDGDLILHAGDSLSVITCGHWDVSVGCREWQQEQSEKTSFHSWLVLCPLTNRRTVID